MQVLTKKIIKVLMNTLGMKKKTKMKYKLPMLIKIMV